MNNKKTFILAFLLLIIILVGGFIMNNIYNSTRRDSVKASVNTELSNTKEESKSSLTLNVSTLPLEECKQVIIVTVPNESDSHGNIYVYEKNIKNEWQHLWAYACVVGQCGVSANRHEGDMTTPEGIYGFLFAFGSAENPGTKLEYRQTHPDDYWSSLPTKEEYNTWVAYNGNDPNKRFGGFDRYENLYSEPLYKYAAALDFNYYPENKTIGKGSAIFFHIAPSNGGGTAGCIALEESNLVNILKWMDPDKNPKICIGTENYLKSLK